MKRFYFPLLCVVVLGLAALAQTQTFTTLYSFTGQLDGGTPIAGVVQDPAGNLYGTALNFGSCCGNGVVYEVNAAGNRNRGL
jgi:hypothetical protein